MPRALAIPAAILTILHSYVSALTPICLPGFNWSFNSMGQSPCDMATVLGDICNEYLTFPPLQPGDHYLGPDENDLSQCLCSTVEYSLISACALCQNGTLLKWSTYDAACTNVSNQFFPLKLPTAVPHYAYLDVVTGDTFDVIAAMNAGGLESSAALKATITPPSTPTSVASSTLTSVGSTTTSVGSTPTSVAATSKPEELNVGALVGGVVGGVLGIIIVAGVIGAFIVHRCLKRPARTPSTYTELDLMMRDGTGRA